ncbi:glycosyltransferase [bacterium]|nr:glycosyltransferase [bacterium]
MKIQILHIIECLSLGGAGRSLLGLIRHSNSDTTAHTLISLLSPDRQALKEACDLGIDIESPERANLLKQISKADVVQIHFWNCPELYRILELQWPPARTLLWCHISGDHAPQCLTPELVQYTDALIASSPHTAQLSVFKNVPEDKITEVIIDTPDFEKLDNSVPNKQSHFTVVYIGTIDFIKMHPDFIEMHAAAKIPELKVIVCGDGPALATLKNQAKQTEQPDRFEFVGFQTEPAHFLAKADLFGYPLADKNYATSELALQEAMYMGVLPLLLAQNGPSLMLKDGETGVLAHSANDYTQKLENLATNPEDRTRLGQKAAAFARLNWGSNRTAPQMLALYHRLMDKPKRRAPALFSDREHPGAHRFIRSLGAAAALPFRQSLEGGSIHYPALLEAADNRISESSALLTSPSAGGVLHYRFSYPQDKHLRYWSGLILAKQGRHALAALEFSVAKKLGFDANRIAPHLKHETAENPSPKLDTSPTEQTESTPQGPFPRALHLIQKGKGKVLFCGNSITAQRSGYRSLLESWLHHGLEQPSESLNAVLGGVGSFGCAFLFHTTLNRHREAPALCFIECLSGDIGIKANPEEIGPDLESMVRRLLKRGSSVCFLFLYHHRWNTDTARNVRGVYQKLAQLYEIPIIDVASEFQRLIDTGAASEASLLRDRIHTRSAGSYLAFSQIAQSLTMCTSPAGAAQANNLLAPAYPTAASYLHTLNLEPSQLETVSQSKWGRFQLVNRFLQINPGESLDFTLKEGSLAGILFINGPHSGQLKHTTSNSKNEYTLTDKWCNYQRLHVLRFEERPESTGKIGLRPTGLDTSGNLASLKISALLIRSNRSQLPTSTFTLNKL